ncbi:hypothetical protein GOV11_03130 [Candidatus Woesearchaeota archaeon]|nr:hypothetical protein [Candidatus Woesearchaeota archaeon]
MGITFVLYRPEHPGNIGMIARACANFGFSDVVIVDPKCKINLDAKNLAKRAQETLEGFKILDEIPKFDLLVMTHGRESDKYNMVRSMITPRQLKERLDDRAVGIVFGPEGEGLPPEMLKKADIILSIPTTREYGSMNLALSVGIVLYELSENTKSEKITERFKPMTGKDKEVIMDLVDECLSDQHYPNEPARDTMRMAWRRMVGRAFLTEKEASAIMGFLKRYQGKR